MSNLKQIKATAVAGALLVSASVSNVGAQQKAGILGVDHVGINVPDMNQAVHFFTDVLGFSAVTTLGPIPLDDASKKNNRMQPGTGAVTIKMVKAGTGANIELFEYQNNKGSKQFPGAANKLLTDLYTSGNRLVTCFRFQYLEKYGRYKLKLV